MKKGIKIVALALALLTVISLFAGCNKNKEDDTGMPAFVFKPEYNEAKINSGDPVAIAEVVRDLYRSQSQSDQSYSERPTLYISGRVLRTVSGKGSITTTTKKETPSSSHI